jgi:hypothetical protein
MEGSEEFRVFKDEWRYVVLSEESGGRWREPVSEECGSSKG